MCCCFYNIYNCGRECCATQNTTGMSCRTVEQNRTRAGMQGTRIWWNLGVTLFEIAKMHFTTFCTYELRLIGRQGPDCLLKERKEYMC